jgi:hypothetical protein
MLWLGCIVCGCGSKSGVAGYWVRDKDVGKPTNAWLHLDDDGHCEVSTSGERFQASYRLSGQTLVLSAEHELHCDLTPDTLACVGEGGVHEVYKRSSGKPAPLP